MDAKIDVWGSFFPCFFRMRLRIDVGSIFWGSEPWKSSSRLDGNTIFAKSTFSKKVRKNIDFGSIFGSQTEENPIKKRFEKFVFFGHRFLCVFWRFRFHFEVQKSLKNRKISKRNDVRRHPLKHYRFRAAFRMDFEPLGTRFWMIFESQNLFFLSPASHLERQVWSVTGWRTCFDD